MPVTCSECQGLEASLEVPPIPQGERVTRDGGTQSLCAICLPQLLGSKYWMGKIRKSPTVSEEVSKEIGPVAVWIMWGTSFKV